MAFAAIVPALISGATSLIGSSQAQSANSKAARLQIIQQDKAKAERAAALEQVVARSEATLAAQLGMSAEAIKTVQDGAIPQLDAIRAAARDAAANIQAGMTAAVDAYGQGEAASTAELRAISADNAPGMAYLRTIIADPESLTPYQQKQLEDARRTVTGTIRNSSLAGSGRTAAAVFKDVESDYALKAQEQNRQAALQVAGVFANNDMAARNRVATNKTDLAGKVGATYDASGRLQADVAQNAGNRIANIYGDTAGKVATLQTGQGSAMADTNRLITNAVTGTSTQNANTTEQQGTVQANATTANGKLQGEAIGAIGGQIADAFRQSKYTDDTKKIASTISSGTGGLF